MKSTPCVTNQSAMAFIAARATAQTSNIALMANCPSQKLPYTNNPRPHPLQAAWSYIHFHTTSIPILAALMLTQSI